MVSRKIRKIQIMKNKKTLYGKYGRVMKYCFFGGCSAAIEFIVFYLLKDLVPIYVSSVISFFAGLISSFLFNKYIVFRKKGINRGEIVQFVCLGLVNSQMSSFVTILFTSLLPQLMAKMSSIILIAIWNYFIMSKLVFTSSKHEDKPDTSR